MKSKNCSVNLFMVRIDMTRKALTVKVIGLGLESGISISDQGRDFSPLRNVHAPLGPTQFLWSVYRGLLPGEEVTGAYR